MSNETTNPVVKWILIGVIAVSFCVVGAFVLLMTPPTKEHRAAKKLQAQGFKVIYVKVNDGYWQYPYKVVGNDLSITENGSRLIGQLSHLEILHFQRCDLSRLNLDNIGNCQELRYFACEDVTQFPADEIGKLAVCPIYLFGLRNASLNDSNLMGFAKWTKLEKLIIPDNIEITDAGLDHLEKIASLNFLYLARTSVTQEGVDEFQRKRPDVRVQLLPVPSLDGDDF